MGVTLNVRVPSPHPFPMTRRSPDRSSPRSSAAPSQSPLGWTVAAAAVTLVVAVALSVPGEWVPRFAPPVEFAVHAAAFAAACGVWGVAGRSRLGTVFALGVVAAIGTEWLQQAVVPLRTGSASDALANGLGVALGVGVTFVLRRRRATSP